MLHSLEQHVGACVGARGTPLAYSSTEELRLLSFDTSGSVNEDVRVVGDPK